MSLMDVNNSINLFSFHNMVERVGLGLGLTPWLAQPAKTLFAVRCKTLDQQEYGTAF
jgi:hypothetical protein